MRAVRSVKSLLHATWSILDFARLGRTQNLTRFTISNGTAHTRMKAIYMCVCLFAYAPQSDAPHRTSVLCIAEYQRRHTYHQCVQSWNSCSWVCLSL